MEEKNLNKRYLEIFRDTQTLKRGYERLLTNKDPEVVDLARAVLMETRSTYDWQEQFLEERFDAKKH